MTFSFLFGGFNAFFFPHSIFDVGRPTFEVLFGDTVTILQYRKVGFANQLLSVSPADGGQCPPYFGNIGFKSP
jgi:hypothetical protein